jgi:hypothetical protein
LVIVGLEDGTHSAFILCDGLVIEVATVFGDAIRDQTLMLVFCYYAWGLTYPKQFQLLPFIQEHVVQDSDLSLFKSTAYSKFNMAFKTVKARSE